MNFYKTIKENLISGAKAMLAVIVVLAFIAVLNYALPQSNSQFLSKSSVPGKQSDSLSENQKKFGIPVLAQGLDYNLITLYTTKCSWIVANAQNLDIDSDDYPNGNPNPVNFWRDTCQDEMGNDYLDGDPRQYPPACNAGDTEVNAESQGGDTLINCYPEGVALNLNIHQRVLPSGGVGWFRHFSVAYTGTCERQCLHQPEYWW